MLRMYLIILVVVGVGASLLGRLPQQSSSAGRESVTVPFPAAASNSSATDGQSVNEMDRSIELTRDANGYFYADVQINGAPVHMVVDTGATVIALSRNDAQMAGLATSIGMNDVIGQGADGVVKGEQVTLDRVTLGDKTVEAVPAIVLSNGGQSLLGQSFLTKFASVKIEGDKMVLR
jgi:aspartyl protease family protein